MDSCSFLGKPSACHKPFVMGELFGCMEGNADNLRDLAHLSSRIDSCAWLISSGSRRQNPTLLRSGPRPVNPLLRQCPIGAPGAYIHGHDISSVSPKELSAGDLETENRSSRRRSYRIIQRDASAAWRYAVAHLTNGSRIMARARCPHLRTHSLPSRGCRVSHTGGDHHAVHGQRGRDFHRHRLQHL